MSDCGGANFFRSYPSFPLPFIIRFALLGFFEEGPSHPPTGHGKGKGTERERENFMGTFFFFTLWCTAEEKKIAIDTAHWAFFPLLPFLAVYEARELHRPAETPKKHCTESTLAAQVGPPFPFLPRPKFGRGLKRENLERGGSWRESAQ